MIDTTYELLFWGLTLWTVGYLVWSVALDYVASQIPARAPGVIAFVMYFLWPLSLVKWVYNYFFDYEHFFGYRE